MWLAVESQGLAVVRWKHQKSRIDRDQTLNGPVEEGAARLRLSVIRMQLRPAHSGEKQRVAGKQKLIVKQVTQALCGMAGRADRLQRSSTDSNGVSVADPPKSETRATLRRQ